MVSMQGFCLTFLVLHIQIVEILMQGQIMISCSNRYRSSCIITCEAPSGHTFVKINHNENTVSECNFEDKDNCGLTEENERYRVSSARNHQLNLKIMELDFTDSGRWSCVFNDDITKPFPINVYAFSDISLYRLPKTEDPNISPQLNGKLKDSLILLKVACAEPEPTVWLTFRFKNEIIDCGGTSKETLPIDEDCKEFKRTYFYIHNLIDDTNNCNCKNGSISVQILFGSNNVHSQTLEPYTMVSDIRSCPAHFCPSSSTLNKGSSRFILLVLVFLLSLRNNIF